MSLDVVTLTQEMVRFPSVSRWSNAPVSDYLQGVMEANGFTVERLEYTDENGELKVSLIGQIGEGTGGLAFFSHTDTVPGQEVDWDPFDPVIKNGRLYGRGSCDMKGPLAATLVAALSFDPSQLKQPIFIVATADEEIGGIGAKHVTEASKLLANTKIGVVAEPTKMIPVYAHKGFGSVIVTAHGKAAHTSTGLGTSANFLIAPFLAEMAAYAQEMENDPSYQNDEFNPPTNGFNMTLNDGGTADNVTAAQTVCRLNFRAMPNDRTEEVIDHIIARADHYGFDSQAAAMGAFYTQPSAPIVQAACAATGIAQPETVPYGTDAFFLKEKFEMVILGPGDISLAHTVGEYIPVADLHNAVEVYKKMIAHFCL